MGTRKEMQKRSNYSKATQEFRIQVSVWRIIVYLQVPLIPYSQFAFYAMGEHQFLHSIQDSDPKECDLTIDEGVCA